MNYGYIKSELDGTELDLDKVFGGKKSMNLPSEFDFTKTITPLKTVKNQGSTPMCVCYSLAYTLETIEFMSNPKIKFELDKNKIYSIRGDKTADGMQIKEALEYVKRVGYKVGKETHRILDYGKLTNIFSLKQSIFFNGPCLMALPVYDDGDNLDFWHGSEFSGGHAVCCVGYNNDGFIIENSWGPYWGVKGKTILPYDDLDKLYEAWGILN